MIKSNLGFFLKQTKSGQAELAQTQPLPTAQCPAAEKNHVPFAKAGVRSNWRGFFKPGPPEA